MQVLHKKINRKKKRLFAVVDGGEVWCGCYTEIATVRRRTADMGGGVGGSSGLRGNSGDS